MFSDPTIITRPLLEWYKVHRRSFSFRGVTDPYGILIAEVMFRQTTARQVDKVWPQFMSRFPNPESLAKADIEEVKELIAPLGIRSRARQLKEIAKVIVEEWQGKIPPDPAKLMKLPGVGEYIANCVVSFCYGIRLPLIDSNVKRVLSRVLGLSSVRISKREKDNILRHAYLKLASAANPRQLHCAMLDLAALLCRPEKTQCRACPIRKSCVYGLQQISTAT